MEWQNIAKLLIVSGLVLLLLGLVIYILSRLGFHGFWGDIVIKKGNFTFFFPIVTCIVLSLLLTIIVNLFLRR